jgi:hypothetical protein
MARPHFIHRLLGNVLAAPSAWVAARRQQRVLASAWRPPQTLEDYIELERLLWGDRSASETVQPRLPARPKVDARTDWRLGTCWDLEQQIYDRLLFIGFPGQFAECIPRDWEALLQHARTGEQRQLCRQGAAVRARKELGCRSRGWRKERKAFRDVAHVNRNDTPLDGLAPAQPRTTVSGIGADASEFEHERRTSLPPPGPPPAKRLNQTRTRRTRRGGHGASSHAGMRRIAGLATRQT